MRLLVVIELISFVNETLMLKIEITKWKSYIWNMENHEELIMDYI